MTEAIVTLPVDRDGKPARVHTGDGEPVDTATAAVLLCDALLQPVGVDPSGSPLNWGRRRRLFTPAQRTALGVRDGGCVFPGCDQPVSRCDAHHQQPWETGGATDLVNGALLCRRHHRLEHSNTDWKLHTVTVADLPAELAEQHRQRAANAGLDTGESAIDPGGSTSSGRSGNPSSQGGPSSSGGTAISGGTVRDGEQHGVGDSGCRVWIWTGPDGQRLLAQIAADHHPPPVGKPQTPPGTSDPPPAPEG
ncbi:MAG: HNH endonuclease signature motif containing protein [Microthrixaceae bacterium]